jgi:hypothetical protein
VGTYHNRIKKQAKTASEDRSAALGRVYRFWSAQKKGESIPVHLLMPHLAR